MVVPSWGKRCGVAEYARALAAALRDLGEEILVISHLPHPPAPGEHPGYDVLHLQYEYGLYNIAHLRAFVRAVRAAGVPLVLTLHAFSPAAPPAYNACIRDGFDRIIVHSEQVRSAVEAGGVPAERLVRIPMGCPSYPLPGRAEARNQHRLRGDPAVGFFGFMFPQKGVIPLGAALRQLRERLPAVRGYFFSSIASENPTSAAYYGEVKSAFDTLGLWDGIHLSLEYLPEEEVVRRLHGLDLIVLPYAEHAPPTWGTSAAVRTAMAALRPILTTDTSYFSDLQGEVFKISRPEPAAIAAGIYALWADARLQRRLVAACVRHLEEHSWRAVALRHRSVYEGLAASARRAKLIM